ncbi:hypothetical protein BDV96DRAFT_493598 [Lophiotrema nucula]|uniref:Uncharacterized protein n=1 Tax=Lophiotrema nucula TaxID=690887 RepID=A0A6A5Z6N4_9PLEO|nr:hypothetical protein BDV96DRAFT_493598 [Lophiotrema nucula]
MFSSQERLVEGDGDVHPVQRAPAPWETKSECYWMFLWLSKLPDGVYDPLEEECMRKDGAEFKGGLGSIMVVRYLDTPVGPYDELMIIPGNYTVPQPSSGPPKMPKKALRISRIYVSQRTTTYNGRISWNIPKHLARFSFSAPPTVAGESPPETLTIKVFPPGTKDGDGVVPFFAVTLKPFRWIPSLPMSSRWMPLSTVHAQPPVAEAPGFKQAVEAVREGLKIEDYDIDPKHEESLLAGTDRWRSFPINVYVSRARGCWVTIHDVSKDGEASTANDVNEPGKYWPQDVKPWAVGAWMEDAQMDIPTPLEWKL